MNKSLVTQTYASLPLDFYSHGNGCRDEWVAYDSHWDVSDFKNDFEDQETGSLLNSKRYVSITMNHIVSDAYIVLEQIVNPDQKAFAVNIINCIQEILHIFTESNFEVYSLPQIKAFIVEDDKSVLLEWIFSDFRIGFNVDSNVNESSWYLVTKKLLGEIQASGDLLNNNKNTIWLFLYIFLNEVNK